MYPWGLQTSFFRGCLIRMTGHILDKFKLSLTAMVSPQTTVRQVVCGRHRQRLKGSIAKTNP